MFPAVVNFKINIPGILSRVWIYIEVGLWLHAISLLCTISSLYFYQLTEEAFIYHDIPGIIVFGYFFLHMLTIPFFAELDAYSRFQNYKSMKDLLYHYGFQIRFIKTLRHSKCQREGTSGMRITSTNILNLVAIDGIISCQTSFGHILNIFFRNIFGPQLFLQRHITQNTI
jgi:hypothetical protein